MSHNPDRMSHKPGSRLPLLFVRPAVTFSQGSHISWKVMEFKKGLSRPGMSWKMTVVVESHGIPSIGYGIF